VRAKIGISLAFALVIGSALANQPAAGATSAVPEAAAPRTPTRSDAKLPWAGGGVRVAPNRFVVEWRAGASGAATRALSAEIPGGGRVSRVGPRIDVVTVPPGTSVDAAIRRYQRSPLVAYAEPDRFASTMALPDDTHFAQQWALDNTGQKHEMTDQGLGSGRLRRGTADADVDAPEAWTAQTVHQPTVVAVIDTGVDVNHPDLQNSLWVNTAEQGGAPGVDDDGNGFVDDVKGWDFYGKDANPSPTDNLENSHGSHVAGIIAAKQNNTTGVSGVCPDCQIMALRIGTARTLSLSRELAAIGYAIHNGADVINLSLGSPVWSPAERNKIVQAGDAGLLTVVAAGNASLDNDISFYAFKDHAWAPSFPASYALRTILSVAASDDRDRYGYVSQCQGRVPLWKCGFTSWGHDSVDVAAPGVDILSTVRTDTPSGTYNDYEFFDGTSMASPMVAGIAGLVLAENPTYSPSQVKNAIMQSVDHPSALKLYTSWADVTGVGKQALSGRFTRTQGRVNAFKALTGSTSSATPSTDGNIDGAGTIDTRRSGRLSWPTDANDVFKRRLVKRHQYQVTVDGPRGKDFDLWIWNPGTKEIFQFTSGCFQRGGRCPSFRAASTSTTADEGVTFRAHRTGTYFIQVNGWYSGGRYTLKIRRV
jgi:subtilisin family serine protease